ncbi:DUF1963 domain-containing protein [Kribbella pittospori]|uniref:DUF1963 domain-containing protein n=1 Tax=Kribbella pittospori TaxID=722689 RepID=A0A4R0KHJ9_9ACTN|nr:YwqG family protein [Kribbella pittospori]TCC59390.1 DUF1963 domain-containing protein [Kribbella pittospori]
MTTTNWTHPPTTPDEFVQRLRQLGLSEYTDRLLAMCRHSVRLLPDQTDGRRTQLGGKPELPEETPWPVTDGRPLSFIAQVDCSELPTLDDGPLPASGLLSFFYDGVEQAAWGFDPTDADHWRVIYTPPTTPSAIRDFPPDLEPTGRYEATTLRPEIEWTIPPWESFAVEELGIGRAADGYADVFGDSDSLIHRLLGHPEPVQGDMQHECQLASNGIYCGDSTYTESARAQKLLPASSEWRLLLQVDSAEDLGMMWGDVGRLYYWIRDQDLRDREWDKVWLVLQCS